MSGAGDTVTAPPASAADTLSVEGAHGGATRAARVGGAAKPSAAAATATMTVAQTVLVGIRKPLRIRDPQAMSAGVYHGGMGLSDASAQVKGILDAAEQAARRLREQAEERAAERIAEADRAAANRVQAAEEEAAEILVEARTQAEQARNEAVAAVGATHAEGERRLAVQRAEAQEKANEMRARARAQAREIVSEAHSIAREVLRDGSEMSRNLRDLSASLRTNAERLLRDVKLAHGSMTARLDQAAPGSAPARETRREGNLPHSRRAPHEEPGSDLDVPEFMPRG